MQNKLIFILIFANIFVICMFSFWIDMCNEKKRKLLHQKRKLLHQVAMLKLKDDVNKYKIKFQIAKAENARLERIKISKEELEKDWYGKN